MNAIERAQMWHLRRKWHAHADELVRDEQSGMSWFLLDLTDTMAGINSYRADGTRRVKYDA